MKIIEIYSKDPMFDELFVCSKTYTNKIYIKNLYTDVYLFLNEDICAMLGDYKLTQLAKTFNGEHKVHIIIGLILPEEIATLFLLAYKKFPCEDYNPEIHKCYEWKPLWK